MTGERPSERTSRAHPDWCAGDVTAEFDGTEHVSGARRWRPVYECEVEISDVLRQVVYPDGGAETPAAIVRIENVSHVGEVAMTVEDVMAFAVRLLRLRAALVGEGVDPRE